MLRIVLSTDWIALRDHMIGCVARDVAQQKKNRIYMVPELISHDTERRLCAVAGDTASRYAEVLSFTRLHRAVSEYSGVAMEDCLDGGGRLVAMAAAARQLHSQLKVYASVETKPEFLASMVETVDELKRCCITAQDLMDAAAVLEGSFSEKLKELALLLESYDAICAQGKRDPRDRDSMLLQVLEDCDFARDHCFYIDGFPDFTRQHIQILEHLIQFSPEVTIGFNCDRLASGALAFEKAGQTAAQLHRWAQAMDIPVEIERLDGRENALTGICKALFQGELSDGQGHLHANRAESVRDEVTAAAQQVMELVRCGCRYRDIGIVCGDMAAYQNMMELIFHRFGIPVYQAGNEDILQKTAIFTVIAAMEAALGGFEQRDVLRYLKSILSPLTQDQSDDVENYALTWGVQGSGWLKPWQKHPDGLGQFWTEETQQRLLALNEARQLAIRPLEQLHHSFEDAKNLSDKVLALYEFLVQIRLAERMDALAQTMEDSGDPRGAQILDQLWNIMLAALEQMHDVLGQTQWDNESFLKLFTLLLSQYDVGTIPTVLDAVNFGPVSAQRCNQVKHLIVLGVNEGAMPGYSGSQSLLSDQERETLRKLNVPLTGGAMEGIQAEFAEIYGVFCGATDSITVYTSGGQPSYVFRRLAQMAGGEKDVKPYLGAAVCVSKEAAAFLAGFNDLEAAQRLQLQEDYWDMRSKSNFELGNISRENVQGLYGRQLNLSASQIDRQAECRMSYFLKYGLRAKERKEATVDPAEFGTYVHAVLEKTARKVMELGGFHEVSMEQTMDIAMEYSKEYADERFADMDSQRMAYLFHRNRRELEMVVGELWKELKVSSFTPDDFELRFGDGGRMDAIRINGASLPAVLRGFVDRVDIWQEDGRNYFRVVDYKTGKKDFDYCDVFNGVGLQMLLYLFALEQGGYGTGAGVQYFPARAALLSADGKLTEEEADNLRSKEWKRKGLLLHDEQVLDAMDPEDWQRLCATRKKDGTVSGDLADREQLQMLRSYIFSFLKGMVDDIASGNVQANPYTRGTSHDACSFCLYSAVCHKEEVAGRRNYKAINAQEFWDRVEKEVDRHG